MKTYTYIFIIGVMALLASCSRSPIQAELDRAEALLPTDPDSAYAMLCGMDASALPEGSELEARYALLFTECQYKTYNDAPNDSLISLAADYYEEHGSEEEKFYAYLYQGLVRKELYDYENASYSLVRSMLHVSGIKDCYARGQLFSNIALINAELHCSDAAQYAERAYHEFVKGDLQAYAANALVLAASNKMQLQDDDSCRILLDSALTIAKRESCEYVLQECYSLLAGYAVSSDSLELAEFAFQKLREFPHYTFSSQNLGDLAVLYAHYNPQRAWDLLPKARYCCKSSNDTISFYSSAYLVSLITEDYLAASLYRDTLFVYESQLLAEQNRHTTLAAQRDYVEWKAQALAERNKRLYLVAIFMSICILMTVALALLNHKKWKIQKKLLEQTLAKHALERAIHAEERHQNLEALQSDNRVCMMLKAAKEPRCLTVDEWNDLTLLFRTRLPHFERELKELITMSETEWHICMLLKLSVSPSDIATLINRVPGTVSSARSQMFRKAFKRKGSTADWDKVIREM